MRAVRTGLVIAAALGLSAGAWGAAAPRARAYEDQAGLALGVGYAVLPTDGPRSPTDLPLPQHGLVIQAQGAIGLNDTFELRALASWAMYLGDSTLHRISGGLELVYLLDILEWVPFVGVGIDVPTSIHAYDDGVTRTTTVWVDFAGHAVVGVDWLPSREWTIGIEVRPSVRFTALDRDPVSLSALFRAQLLFEI